MTLAAEITLLPHEETAKRVRCRICGRWTGWSRSRLFWLNGNTVRTCAKGLAPHK